MDSITQTAKFRLSTIKFSKKHGVTTAAKEFNVSRQTIYWWRKRYDGTEESLKPKSRRPHHHPNQHSPEEIELGCVGKLKMANKSGKKNEIQEANIEFVESDCDMTKLFHALKKDSVRFFLVV